MASAELALRLQCSNLPSLDKAGLGKSDPFARFYLVTKDHKVQLGHTQIIKNNNNPKWEELFKITYYFELFQMVRVEVLDYDSPTKAKVIGVAEIPVGKIFSSPGQSASQVLTDLTTGEAVFSKKKPSLATVACEIQSSDADDLITIALRSENLAKMDGVPGWRWSSDPYVKIRRGEIPVKTTEHYEKNLNPVWQPFVIGSHALCNNREDDVLTFEVFDKNSHQNDELIGACSTTLKEMKDRKVFALPLKRDGRKATKVTYGNLVFDIHHKKRSTFLEYLRGGTQISLMVAIDFTGSNCPGGGNPKTTRHSLHRMVRGEPDNDYVKAIKTVCSALTPYVTNQQCHVWGYGAITNKVKNEVNNCFNLHIGFRKTVTGIKEIIDAYAAKLDDVQMSGPTNFATIINRAMTEVKSTPWTKHTQHYHILLILTDGTNHDLDDTTKALVKASALPLSVIIVGVGPHRTSSEDFRNMVYLDAGLEAKTSQSLVDPVLKDSAGNIAERDVVQFVKLNDAKYRNHADVLAKETLAELPSQFLAYMRSRNPPIEPLDPGERMKAEREKFKRFVENNHGAKFNHDAELSPEEQAQLLQEQVEQAHRENLFGIEPEAPSAPPPDYSEEPPPDYTE